MKLNIPAQLYPVVESNILLAGENFFLVRKSILNIFTAVLLQHWSNQEKYFQVPFIISCHVAET